MPSSGVQTCADRKSTRLNSSHTIISYAVFCLKKKNIAAGTPAPPLVHPHALPAPPAAPAADALGATAVRAGAARRGRVRALFRFFLKAPGPPESPPLPPPAPFPF